MEELMKIIKKKVVTVVSVTPEIWSGLLHLPFEPTCSVIIAEVMYMPVIELLILLNMTFDKIKVELSFDHTVISCHGFFILLGHVCK